VEPSDALRNPTQPKREPKSIKFSISAHIPLQRRNESQRKERRTNLKVRLERETFVPSVDVLAVFELKEREDRKTGQSASAWKGAEREKGRGTNESGGEAIDRLGESPVVLGIGVSSRCLIYSNETGERIDKRVSNRDQEHRCPKTLPVDCRKPTEGATITSPPAPTAPSLFSSQTLLLAQLKISHAFPLNGVIGATGKPFSPVTPRVTVPSECSGVWRTEELAAMRVRLNRWARGTTGWAKISRICSGVWEKSIRTLKVASADSGRAFCSSSKAKECM
jgi:hypothetical protein